MTWRPSFFACGRDRCCWVDDPAVAERGGCLSARDRDCCRVDEPAVAEGGGYCAAICSVDPVGDEVVAGQE